MPSWTAGCQALGLPWLTLATPLADFLEAHRVELLRRCAQKAHGSHPPPLDASGSPGIPAFVDMLVAELRLDSQTRDIRIRSAHHGRNLYFLGFTASEVVHDYGNVCQAVTDLAVEHSADIAAGDLRILHRCLDEAIAAAVASYTEQLRHAGTARFVELRVLVDSTIAAFEILQSGRVGAGGRTGALIRRSLLALRAQLAAVPSVTRIDA